MEFADLVVQELKARVNKLHHDEMAQSLLKLLIELRESARKNNDYDAFDKITAQLAGLGITMREETHIVPTVATSAHP